MDNLAANKTTHRYKIYGLTVESWMAFPELEPAPSEAPVDVVFRLGETPAEIPGCLQKGARFQAAPGQLLVWMDGVARFLALEGREIVVEPAPGASDNDIRVLLLCSPLGAILLQRGLLPLHASAIATPRGAVLFMGASGVGKSTLAAEFRRRGFRPLADDISVVTFDEKGLPWVAAGYPQFKLWPDSAGGLVEDPAALPKMRKGSEKLLCEFRKDFKSEAMPLHGIYLLQTGSNVELTHSVERGLRRVTHLIEHTYRNKFLTGLQGKADHFKLVAKLAESVKITRVARPRGRFMLREVADWVAADIVL